MSISQLESCSLVHHQVLAEQRFIFGQSQAMRALEAKLTTVAMSKVPILICGDLGTGKELLARLIHGLSSLRNGSFVKINCATAPATLFDSELLAHENGELAATNGKNAGRLAMANSGTLFLDEVTELDEVCQAKLLQLLQEGSLCPADRHNDAPAEIRIICATNGNPEQNIASGTFREDLYYRINVIGLRLPPLRERREDIPGLAQHFVEFFNARFNCQAPPLSPRLTLALKAFDWPGNVSQLENMMKRYSILGSEEAIVGELNSNSQSHQLVADIPEISASKSISLKSVTKEMVRNFERQIITKVLEAHRWNRAEAARALNISYRSLLYKVKSSQVMNPRIQGNTQP